jgi:hypothetical protein
MEFKRTTDIQVFQNTNQITLDDQIIQSSKIKAAFFELAPNLSGTKKNGANYTFRFSGSLFPIMGLHLTSRLFILYRNTFVKFFIELILFSSYEGHNISKPP